MSAYSAESQRLARQLAEKATRNLERSGKTVIRGKSGGWSVKSRSGQIVNKNSGSDKPSKSD